MEFVKELWNGYKLYRDENKIYIKTPEGKGKYFMPADKPLYLGASGTKNIEEAEKLVKEGKAKKYNIKDLYRMAFEEEEFYKIFYGMSKRMKIWLDRFYKSRGLVARYSGWEERDKEADKLLEGATLIETFNNPFSPADVEVYKLQDGRYAIEFAVVYGDTFDIRTLILNKKPSIQTFNDILDAEEIEAKIRIYRYPESFTCWECGRETHFTEICAKDISERKSYWEDSYCGCC